MKIIRIDESQFNKLLESVTDGNFGSSNIKQSYGSEVLTSPTIHDKNGDLEMSDPHDSEDLASTLTPQQWGVMGTRKSSNTI